MGKKGKGESRQLRAREPTFLFTRKEGEGKWPFSAQHESQGRRERDRHIPSYFPRAQSHSLETEPKADNVTNIKTSVFSTTAHPSGVEPSAAG